MANKLKKHWFVDGLRNGVLYLEGDADGEGDLSNLKLFDMNSINHGQKRIKIMKVVYETGVGTDVEILFTSADGTGAYEEAWHTSTNESSFYDWTDVGGLPNDEVVNPDGGLALTTVGYEADGDHFSMTIYFKKVHKTATQGLDRDPNAFGWNP